MRFNFSARALLVLSLLLSFLFSLSANVANAASNGVPISECHAQTPEIHSPAETSKDDTKFRQIDFIVTVVCSGNAAVSSVTGGLSIWNGSTFGLLTVTCNAIGVDTGTNQSKLCTKKGLPTELPATAVYSVSTSAKYIAQPTNIPADVFSQYFFYVYPDPQQIRDTIPNPIPADAPFPSQICITQPVASVEPVPQIQLTYSEIHIGAVASCDGSGSPFVSAHITSVTAELYRRDVSSPNGFVSLGQCRVDNPVPDLVAATTCKVRVGSPSPSGDVYLVIARSTYVVAVPGNGHQVVQYTVPATAPNQLIFAPDVLR